MTKKEFIELIKDVPDDWDIVFRTNSERLDICLPLVAEHITMETQCTNTPMPDDYNLGWLDDKEPVLRYKKAIVIEAIPYDYLANKYFIHIDI